MLHNTQQVIWCWCKIMYLKFKQYILLQGQTFFMVKFAIVRIRIVLYITSSMLYVKKIMIRYFCIFYRLSLFNEWIKFVVNLWSFLKACVIYLQMCLGHFFNFIAHTTCWIFCPKIMNTIVYCCICFTFNI